MRVIPLLVALLVATTAQAEIQRHCDGEIIVRHPLIDSGGWRFVGTLKGRGVCDSRLKANECRRIARNAIDGCVREAWRARHAHVLPMTCAVASGRNGALLSWQTGPYGGRSDSIKDRIEWAACCNGSGLGEGTLRVTWSTFGDKACGSPSSGTHEAFTDNLLSSTYGVDCRARRAAGICG